jgi:hypothetical protein
VDDVGRINKQAKTPKISSLFRTRTSPTIAIAKTITYTTHEGYHISLGSKIYPSIEVGICIEIKLNVCIVVYKNTICLNLERLFVKKVNYLAIFVAFLK